MPFMPWLKKGYRDSDHRSGDLTFIQIGIWVYEHMGIRAYEQTMKC